MNARKGKRPGTKTTDTFPAEDSRHDKDNPPARPAPDPAYPPRPHLPPALRFDATGQTDRLTELLEESTRRPLRPDEAQLLAEALRNHEPCLEWAGKRDRPGLAMDPVALHTHERVSARAVLATAARRDSERPLLADPEPNGRAVVPFHHHDGGWSNRLILGDSLLVLSSLARREDLAGKVQMIYLDPPYGIQFASHFQPEVGRCGGGTGVPPVTAKDRDPDLTPTPERVKAFRDTWHLGIHSYLSHLRDRLLVARELLAATGSLFVQMGEQNLHSVRLLLDEVFGGNQYVGMITFVTTGGFATLGLANPCNYLLWYGKDRSKVRFRRLFTRAERRRGEFGYRWVLLPSGEKRGLTRAEVLGDQPLPEGARLYKPDNIKSSGRAQSGQRFEHEGRTYEAGPNNHWKTNPAGMRRLAGAGRIHVARNSIAYVRFPDDFPVRDLNTLWLDTATGNFTGEKRYVVQTNTDVVARCLLMTTDPGDLVLDPTCGSGTTAYVAEQWGRRWITIDTSRVAVALTRRRLLTARYDCYQLRNETAGLVGGFRCRTVPHIQLRSIAQNSLLDAIFIKYEPILHTKLAVCNEALAAVSESRRRRLGLKLLDRQRSAGKRTISTADRRRWELPGKGQGWQHWTVPFDTDPDWPAQLAGAVAEYRQAWRARMDEVNACIAANAQQEELVDQPEVVKGVVRVSGPFTVEGVQRPQTVPGSPATAYLDRMVHLLRSDGVWFPDNRPMRFTRLESIHASEQGGGFHAEGRWAPEGQAGRAGPPAQRGGGGRGAESEGPANVGVMFGPQLGPVTEKMVQDPFRRARRRYQALVVIGFSFTPEAQALVAGDPQPRLCLHLAHVRPDVNPGMDGLLQERPGSQLFIVFGRPHTRLDGPDSDGAYTMTLKGVDIYNPTDNSLQPTRTDRVAAWFLDSDYDGRTFCITQAFFPDRLAWEKLSRALARVVDPERLAAFSGTRSLPFRAGKHRRAAVKVIDSHGNEVMRVHGLPP